VRAGVRWGGRDVVGDGEVGEDGVGGGVGCGEEGVGG
jgi:hypothetical protein